MKKLTVILIVILVPMMALAQRKPATATKSVQNVNNNFAIVLFDEWIQNVYEDADNIYFQGTQYGDLNTLRAMDKQTGALRFIVPKIKSDRARILCSGSNGTDIYMQLEKKGIVRFNGTDVNTSEVLLAEGPIDIETNFIWPANRGESMSFSPNGRYLAMKGDPCIVFDTQTGKVVRLVWRTEESLVVTDNGDSYAMRESAMWKYPNKGGIHSNKLNKFDDKGAETFSFGDYLGSYYGEYHGMYYNANQQAIYVPIKNKVLRFHVDGMQWDEAFAFSNEDKEFGRMAFSSQHALAHTSDYEKPFCLWPTPDIRIQPKTLDKLNTGIKLGKSPYESPEVVNNVQNLYHDQLGNFWIQTSDQQFVVYNPDGIKGLGSLKGKCTKHLIQ